MAYQAAAEYKIPSATAARHGQQSHFRMRPGPFDLVDDADAMDDFAMEHGIISPASAGDRRESFTNSTATIFTPQTAAWDDFTSPAMDRKHNISSDPVFVPNNNPFTRMEHPHIATYAHQPAWTADSRAPFERDVYAGEYEPANAYMAVGSSAPMFNSGIALPNNNNSNSNVRPSSIFPPSSDMETPVQSPLSGDKWMPDDSDVQHKPENRFPRKMNHHHRNHSPSRTGTPAFINPNGVRKKNARFDIPQERNLNTIDSMIAEATDDELIKELKQQKRLLRNRQAALDSRQRKKKHTEELEKEKEEWKDHMAKLEAEVRSLRAQSEQHYHERMQLEESVYAARQQIQTLVYDKEELVANHTRDTIALRKKITYLLNKLESAPVAPSTISPTSTADYTEFGADMSSLAMESDNWDSFMADEQMDPQQQQPQQHANNQFIVTSRPKQNFASNGPDNSLASSVMYTILLFGAWIIASKSGDKAPSVPDMPGEIKAASNAVIKNVFSDASNAACLGHASSQQHVMPTQVHHMEPSPSVMAGSSSWSPEATMTGAELQSMTNAGLGIGQSTLDQMHHSLTAPTLDQEAEQLFGLSVNQYNSLTSTDFSRPGYDIPTHTPPMTDEDGGTPPMLSGRKNLQQSLQNMRDEAWSASTADVSTRSLLWDKIPADVVKEFKRMVLASESANASPRRGEGVENET